MNVPDVADSQGGDPRVLILRSLAGIARGRRIVPDRMLAASLDRLKHHAGRIGGLDLPGGCLEGAALVMKCCIQTRMFIDWLHTRCLLEGAAGTDHWRAEFSGVHQVIHAFAGRVVECLEVTDSPEAARETLAYQGSMSFRKNLSVKLSEGADVGEDLLQFELREGSGLRGNPADDAVQSLPVLAPQADPEVVCALFFLRKAVRFLRHKLLFAAVEFTHEAGPWLESVGDHLDINSNTLDLASSLLDEAAHPALALWVTAADEQMRRVTREVTLELNYLNLGNSNEPVSRAGLDEPGVSEKLRSLAGPACSIAANLEALESKLQDAVSASLHGWETLWGDCGVREAGLRGFVARAGEAGVSALEDWLDGVLLCGWALDPPLECPETVALVLFRKLAAKDSEAAVRYLARFLPMQTEPSVLKEHVALMFAGALLALVQRDGLAVRGWNRWYRLSEQVASGAVAPDYTAAGRVAVAAALLSIGICVARDNDAAADQLSCAVGFVEEQLYGKLHADDHPKIAFLRSHIALNLQGTAWKPGSRVREVAGAARTAPRGEPEIAEATTNC